jgi:hypothetical protein
MKWERDQGAGLTPMEHAALMEIERLRGLLEEAAKIGTWGTSAEQDAAIRARIEAELES